jgi:hypothetical protein
MAGVKLVPRYAGCEAFKLITISILRTEALSNKEVRIGAID